MRRMLFAALLLLASVPLASAQSLNLIKVETCGTGDYSAPLLTVDRAGILCTAGTGHTYTTGIPAYTGYSSPTDFFSIRGASDKIIKIIGIRLSGSATGNNNVDVALLKRSTANSGGSPTTATITPLDSTNPAPSATVVTYGAAPTLGTLVGPVCACQLEVPARTGVGGYILEWQFNRNGAGPIILRDASEMLTLNLYGTTLPAGTNLNITVTWTEE